MRMKLPFFCVFYTLFIGVFNAQASTPFSNYGLIQNVQNYSSSPYWTPDSPYNLRFPTAVYATGPNVETPDCQQIVSTLIYTECATLNNCATTDLTDIRSTIMLQLSRIPGGNYATSCGGYIDTAFAEYLRRYSVAAPAIGNTAFPTTSQPGSGTPEFQIDNPYEKQPTDWQQEIMDRKSELKELQSANGAGLIDVSRSAFPTTYADLSREERIENATAGYQPFAGKSAYYTMKIEDAEKAAARQKKAQTNHNNYCEQYRSRYQTLKSDLNTLEKCRAAGLRFVDCKLKGTYK